MRRLWSVWLFVCIICCVTASSAQAVITAPIRLKDLIEKEEFIFVAKVKEVFPDKPGMVLAPDKNLKGKAPFERMPVNLTGDSDAKKGKHTDVLLERIEKDTPIVFFASKDENGKYAAFGFSNGTWFQLEGRVEKKDAAEVVRWSFLHCEPYLRRTFKGTTDEMKQLVTDVLAKKKEPPALDSKEKPGFGPPIKKTSSVGYPLAVIQLPFLGLIAALAALFPAVFGGLALFMKRWVAALSTTGIVSLFVALPVLAPGWCAQRAVYSAYGMWISCGTLFLTGALWSARRYRVAIARREAEIMQPRRFDRIIMAVLAVVGAGALAIGAGLSLPLWANEIWRWVLAGAVGSTITAYYLITNHLRAPEQAAPLRVSAETVLLFGLAVSCALFGSWESGRFSKHGSTVMAGAGGIGQPSLSPDTAVVWKFEPQLGGMVVNTCATPERVYAAVFAMPRPTSQYGCVYAFDAKTGDELWKFPNAKTFAKDPDFKMKPAFSAPVHADGRLYFGEGLHQHENSRLFCLDAASGDLLWVYETESHTESTPVVADGKVVFGAGYHGIHCVDAINGPVNNQPLWRFPRDAKASDRLLHVDSNPVIADGRVYAGSGYKPDYVKDSGKINTFFCLDLNTGEPKWQHRLEDAVYGSALVKDGRVYHGTGNSTYNEQIDSKRPGVICRDAATGEEIWYRQLPENVLGKPVADRYQLFVGCVDGKAYALDLRSGVINWKLPIDSAIYATPVVDANQESGIADVVYFAGKEGALTAVSPYSSSRIFWSINLSYWTQSAIDQTATPTLLRVEDDKAIRRRLFCGFCQGQLGSGAARLFCIEDLANK